MMDPSETEEDELYGILEQRNIDRVCLGDYEFDTWYGNAVYFAKDQQTLGYKFANLNLRAPKKVLISSEPIWLDKLYVCDNCFKYTDTESEMDQHRTNCPYSIKLPGKIMYRDSSYTIRRVRGMKHKTYCQCLCLFAKLFLDNKSVYFAVEYFDFYVVYGRDEEKGPEKPMGFFSKELLSWDNNNLACILVFPPFQRRKLGHLLMSFSYELSKFEGLVSGPEHPLSPFGLIGYLRYWSKVLCKEFMVGAFSELETVGFKKLCGVTGIRKSDLLMTLEYMKVLSIDTKDDGDYDAVIMKGNIKKWAIDNRIVFNDVLDKDGMILY